MTSEPRRARSERTQPGRAFVWVWLPGAIDPVVAGALEPTGSILDREPVLAFVYARSYLARPEAISLFTSDLPLRPGTFDPTTPPTPAGAVPGPRSATPLAGCLRDAAPDAWGRRVLNMRLAHEPDIDLSELSYLLESGSNRVGALDFQAAATEYVPRGAPATLEELLTMADLVERGHQIPDDLAAAAGHGTSIGGARPKAHLATEGRELIVKFPSSADTRPLIGAEAVGMLLAERVGIQVAPVEVVRTGGRDVLGVERFDRPGDGTRRHVVSALTVLGLSETEARYASYADLAASLRYPGWRAAPAALRELFTRLVFNVAIGNNDDHLRNHAAFWDGAHLELTPAYDLCPQPRSTPVSSQAIAITRGGDRSSQFRTCREVAGEFLIHDAEDVITHVVDTIRSGWDEACDQARLTGAQRAQLWGREFLNEYIFDNQP